MTGAAQRAGCAPDAPAAVLAWPTDVENTYVTGLVVFVDGGGESTRRPEHI